MEARCTPRGLSRLVGPTTSAGTSAFSYSDPGVCRGLRGRWSMRRFTIRTIATVVACCLYGGAGCGPSESIYSDFTYLEGLGSGPDAPNGTLSFGYCRTGLTDSQDDLRKIMRFADSVFLDISAREFGIRSLEIFFFACDGEINPRRSRLCALPNTGDCPDYVSKELYTFFYAEEYKNHCSMRWGPAALDEPRPSLTARPCPKRQ